MVPVSNGSLKRKFESDASQSLCRPMAALLNKCRDLVCFAALGSVLLSSDFFGGRNFNSLHLPSSRETEGLSVLRNIEQKSGSLEASKDTSFEERKPFCLTGPFYGGTGNNVVEIGKLLRILDEEGKHRKLGLDKFWTKWYKSHFDPRPEVLFDYYPNGECEKKYEAQEAFFLGEEWDLSYVRHLPPNLELRQTAERIMKNWPHGNNYISVHRRHLEGTCEISARCPKNRREKRGDGRKCVEHRDPAEPCSVELRLQACNMEYSMIDNPKNLPVILFTDRQVPEKDGTFPYLFNETVPMFVEMWLMAKSQTHWGNPRSSVDAVVSSWRNGEELEPRPCYQPGKLLFQQ